MSNIKHPIPLRVDYDLPAGYRLPPPPRHAARPTRGASPRRRPRRVVVNELWLRRRSLARRAWRQRTGLTDALIGVVILVPCAGFYVWLLWLLAGWVLGPLAGVHVH